MPQRLGEYRDRVIIQRRTDVQDAAGEPRPSWSEFAKRWAKRRVLAGAESFQGASARQAEHAAEFRTHVTRGVDTRMRVLYPGKVTHLAGAVTSATSTSLSVASADGFPFEGAHRLRVASELMDVTAGFGTTTWTVARGVDGTTAATSYATGTKVQHMQPYDVEGVHVDWMRGAETVIAGRLSDGIA